MQDGQDTLAGAVLQHIHALVKSAPSDGRLSQTSGALALSLEALKRLVKLVLASL